MSISESVYCAADFNPIDDNPYDPNTTDGLVDWLTWNFENGVSSEDMAAVLSDLKFENMKSKFIVGLISAKVSTFFYFPKMYYIL